MVETNDDRTFEFEGKVICQVPTLVVATEEKEGTWIPDFEGPQIQDTLNMKQS